MNAFVSTMTEVPKPEWFASWFDSEHYHRLYAHRGRQEAAALVDRLLGLLQPPAGALVLDLGCGAGRHARHLAARGLDVTGLDLSAASLALARAGEGPRLRFRRQDMRTPFGTSAFDYVFNLFTSFGYFADPADHLTVARNIATALTPGGTLVLDYVNVRRAEADLVPDEAIVRDGATYRISRWTDADHLFKRIVIEDARGQRVGDYTERVARLTLDVLQFMFALCGMRTLAVYGDYSLGPFLPAASPRLILVAQRSDGRASAATGSCGCD
jgi:SAM-dependent methyltransferase